MSTSEQLLAKGIQESSKYHRQVGKDVVLSAYEGATQAVRLQQESANQLKQQIGNNKAQAQAVREEQAANHLKNVLSANYPNARGLFTQGEFLSPDNAYGEVAMGTVAESGWAIGVGKTAQIHSSSKAKPTELGKIADTNVIAEAKSDVANLGKNNSNFNRELNNNISLRIENHIYNINAVNKLSKGVLPGDALDSKTKLPVEGKNGVPRNMPSSSNPDLMALDFAEKFLGRKITKQEWENGKNIFRNRGGDKDCNGCFFVDLGNKQSMLYRPGEKNNSGKRTQEGTATLEINTIDIREINSNKSLKLKFPKDE